MENKETRTGREGREKKETTTYHVARGRKLRDFFFLFRSIQEKVDEHLKKRGVDGVGQENPEGEASPGFPDFLKKIRKFRGAKSAGCARALRPVCTRFPALFSALKFLRLLGGRTRLWGKRGGVRRRGVKSKGIVWKPLACDQNSFGSHSPFHFFTFEGDKSIDLVAGYVWILQ